MKCCFTYRLGGRKYVLGERHTILLVPFSSWALKHAVLCVIFFFCWPEYYKLSR